MKLQEFIKSLCKRIRLLYYHCRDFELKAKYILKIYNYQYSQHLYPYLSSSNKVWLTVVVRSDSFLLNIWNGVKHNK